MDAIHEQVRNGLNIELKIQEYVDIDSYNDDSSVTINSDDNPDSTEEDDASKF